MPGDASDQHIIQRFKDLLDDDGDGGSADGEGPGLRGRSRARNTQPKIRHLALKTFEDADLVALAEAYDEWRLDAEEDGFVDWSFEIIDGNYVLVILFTE